MGTIYMLSASHPSWVWAPPSAALLMPRHQTLRGDGIVSGLYALVFVAATQGQFLDCLSLSQGSYGLGSHRTTRIERQALTDTYHTHHIALYRLQTETHPSLSGKETYLRIQDLGLKCSFWFSIHLEIYRGASGNRGWGYNAFWNPSFFLNTAL